MKRHIWLIFFGSSSTPQDEVLGISNNGDQYPYYYSDDVALFQAILLGQNL